MALVEHFSPFLLCLSEVSVLALPGTWTAVYLNSSPCDNTAGYILYLNHFLVFHIDTLSNAIPSHQCCSDMLNTEQAPQWTVVILMLWTARHTFHPPSTLLHLLFLLYKLGWPWNDNNITAMHHFSSHWIPKWFTDFTYDSLHHFCHRPWAEPMLLALEALATRNCRIGFREKECEKPH